MDLVTMQRVDVVKSAEIVVVDDPKQLIDDEKCACLACGKVFKSRNALSDHVKVHSGATKCSLCGKIFSTSGNMKRHILAIHAIVNG